MSKTLTISLAITDTGECAHIKELDGVVATGYSTVDTITNMLSGFIFHRKLSIEEDNYKDDYQKEILNHNKYEFKFVDKGFSGDMEEHASCHVTLYLYFNNAFKDGFDVSLELYNKLVHEEYGSID